VALKKFMAQFSRKNKKPDNPSTLQRITNSVKRLVQKITPKFT